MKPDTVAASVTESVSDPAMGREAGAVAAASAHWHLGRRDFLKTFATGLVVVAWGNPLWAQRESGSSHSREGHPDVPRQIDSWLHLGADGTITFFTGKAELGQNIRTSLTQIVLEELPAPNHSVRMVMADTDLTPWDGGTFGSRTTPQMGKQLRNVAATAREVLLDLAAEAWQVDRSTLEATNGEIRHAATHRKSSYYDLTKGRLLQRDVMDSPPVKQPSVWTIAGTSMPKVNGRAFVTGRHQYASDFVLPGMLHGKVLRPPAYEATLVSFNAADVEKQNGVSVIHEDDFVGVVAPTVHDAEKALALLHAEWKTRAQISEGALFSHLRETSDYRSEEKEHRTDGSSLRRTYHVAYIAHVPLEPRAAVAQWNEGRLTVWTGTQRPFGVRAELAKAFAIPESQVRVIVPDTGSAYGGKHTGEAALEAARLARAAGKPVKLVWTREEEFTWAYFRPAAVIDVSASITPDGSLDVWDFHNLNSGNAGIRAPYRAARSNAEFHPSESPLRQGSYRALAATANHFARESHIDDLARLAKMDPLSFRLKNLNDPRAVAVLKAAADEFRWQEQKASPEVGYGLAVGTEKGSFVATCAEIALQRSTREFRVVRVVQAFECGAIVNPAHLMNQNEGAILQGLGGALFETVHFENGRILNPRLSSYRVPRFADVPEIKIVLLNRPDLSSVGAGETPIVTIAPAIGNAIFSATGVRIASMPLGQRVPPASG
ncbi:MAG TPA: molybdopterin cofactor-binding domain-containing protein [Opitutaceae bacterium]|nr:molybdopterin cofactor-binding domain-containing protein [Opitutaceae bacterium]